MSEKKTAFEWGARSAIQKAIRRSDGPLLVQALDVLWRLEPSWLFWRMPVLAAEEVPQLLGEVGDAVDAAKKAKAAKDNDKAYAITLAMLKKLCSYKKDKTTWALAAYGWNRKLRGFRPPASMTAGQTQRWAACITAHDMIRGGKGDALWLAIRAKAADKPEAVQKIVQTAHYRYAAGGMDFDKDLMAMTAIVALAEYDDTSPEAMRDELVATDTIRTGDWPWFCYDMHNMVGKRALSYVCKKYGLNKEEFSDQWFFYESNVVARGGFSVGFWFEEYRKEFDKYHNTNLEMWLSSNVRRDLSELTPRFAKN